MITTINVIQPPKTTDGTTHISFAATPLSNWPSSLLELINIEPTLLTRSRMWSGVFVPLTTTLTPSSIPAINNAAKERVNHSDSAKQIMQMPKPATASMSFLPCAFFIGKMVSNMMMMMAPISIAALSQPKPCGPIFKISFAYTGTIATAPPNNTANISNVKAPSNSFVLKTKRKPSFTLSHVFFSPEFGMGGFGFNCRSKKNARKSELPIIISVPLIPSFQIRKPPVAWPVTEAESQVPGSRW